MSNSETGLCGFFDGFEGYRTPSDSDYRRIFATGLITLDANVLLNLYRSNGRTRGDLLSVLERLRERIWVPNQAVVEFWRNRESEAVLNHHALKASEAKRTLNQRRQGALDTLERWAKEVHVPAERIEEHRNELEVAFRKVTEMIDQQAQEDSITGASDTNKDPILIRLEVILENRVGGPMPSEDYERALKEAKRRSEAHEPPGYKDFESKEDEQAAGDYLIWEQTITAAKERDCDVLFVTGDIKEDWWRPRTPVAPARPRLELIKEMNSRTGRRLFMLTPSDLLKLAEEILQVDVEHSSVADLERLEQDKFSKKDAWTWSYDPDAEHVVGNLPDAFVAEVEQGMEDFVAIGDEIARGGNGIRRMVLPHGLVHILPLHREREIAVVRVTYFDNNPNATNPAAEPEG
jgi:hypothetical protein